MSRHRKIQEIIPNFDVSQVEINDLLASDSATFARADPGKLLGVMKAADRLIAQAQKVQLEAMAAFNRRRKRARGVAKEIALELTISEFEADRRIALADALTTRLPETLRAMGRGEIDAYKASKIAEPTAVLSDRKAREVDAIMATRLHGKTPSSLRKSTNNAVEKVDPNGHARRAKAKRKDRKLELVHSGDGMAMLLAHLPAEIASSIYGRVDRIARRLRGKDETRTLDQLRADVFADLCLTVADGTTVGPKADVFVYIDLLTLAGLNNNPAELAGHGQIPAWLAKEIAFGENSTWRRLVTDPDTGQLLSVDRRSHRPPAPLDRFVRIRDRECRSPGCHRPTQFGDLDHVQDWGKDGKTEDRNLCGFCKRDHALKDQPGWNYTVDNEGTLTITTPAGKQYTSKPEPLHDPRPAALSTVDNAPPPF